MGSSKADEPSELFWGANMGEFMALVFTELTKLAECMRIGNVLAVPSDVPAGPGDQITQNRGYDVNGFHAGNKKEGKTGAAAGRSRSGGTANGISPYDSFPKELLKDVADVLHDFFSFSIWRVS